MKSSEYRKKLDRIKETVIQECKEAVEAIARRRYSIENGYQYIMLTFPLWNQSLGTPIYINSCFIGEDNILIRHIRCDQDGLSVGCHYIGDVHTWKADIADVCMHERDMVNILELIEKMKFLGIVYEHIHVKI